MVGFSNPTLKRGANNHCAYGAPLHRFRIIGSGRWNFFRCYKIPSTLSRASPPASTPMGEIATCAS